MNLLIIFLIFIWWFAGMTGYIYWWTREYDLGIEDLLFSIAVGLIGPIAWGVGALIHSDLGEKVLIKQRPKR